MARETFEDTIRQPEESETGIGELLGRGLRMLNRKRWIIGTIGSFGAICTVAGTFALPNKYTSEATIFAVQQRVPERYVTPTMSDNPSQALEAMVQEVLSRPQLLGVIDQLGLYREKAGLQPDELLDLIREDLTIEPLDRLLSKGDVYAFRISFVSKSPELAHAVTSRLATLFVEQNIRTRTDQAETTSEFLQEQLEAARKDLLAKEQRLRDYKMQFLGELPEQQMGNLGILGSLHSQLDNLMASRNQAQQQKLYLESLLSEYEQRSRRPTPVRSASGEIVTPVQLAEAELSRLQSERGKLLTTYTAQHPDVLKKETEIALQEDRIKALKSAASAASKKPDTPESEKPDAEQSIVVAQMKSQLLANKLELENLAAKEQKLRADIAMYQSRLNMTPVREQQLTSIQRDYDLLKQNYGDLLKKEQESQLAKDLEKRQEGQQFRLADPPNLPTIPSSPKRLKISLIGLLAGLALGCGLAFLLEFRSPTFYTEDDLKRLELPMVVGTLVIRTPDEERSRSWRRALEWVGAFALVAVVAAAEFYVYRHG